MHACTPEIVITYWYTGWIVIMLIGSFDSWFFLVLLLYVCLIIYFPAFHVFFIISEFYIHHMRVFTE